MLVNILSLSKWWLGCYKIARSAKMVYSCFRAIVAYIYEKIRSAHFAEDTYKELQMV